MPSERPLPALVAASPQPDRGCTAGWVPGDRSPLQGAGALGENQGAMSQEVGLEMRVQVLLSSGPGGWAGRGHRAGGPGGAGEWGPGDVLVNPFSGALVGQREAEGWTEM